MSITESVCPKCGATAGANHYCTNCGLDLEAQYELPSREEWVRRHGPPTNSHRSPSSELSVAPAGNEKVLEGAGSTRRVGMLNGTLGDAISRARLSSVAVLAGLSLVIVGSIAPWATSPLSSASGTEGDGKITIGIAVIAGLLLLLGRGRGRWWIAAISLILLGLGIFEAIHIHKHVAKVTLFGQQVDHVGWGVYALIAGAAVAFTASLIEMTNEMAQTPSSH